MRFLVTGDGRAFLWAFAFRVPAFLDFSCAFRVPALLYDIVFAFPRALAFLFRVPLRLPFTYKASSGVQVPVKLRYNGGGRSG